MKYCTALWRVISILSLTFSLLYSQTTYIEDFESGVPSSKPTTPTNYTLKTGTWVFYQAGSGSAHSGSVGISLSSSSSNPGYIITPVFRTLASVSFWAKAGGSGKTMTIQLSKNGGSFTTIATPSLSSTYTLYTLELNDTASSVQIKIMNTPGSGTTEYIDDVTITTLSQSTITVLAPDTLDCGMVVRGNHSAVKTYTVSARKLETNLTITVNAPFEISTDNVGYSSSVILSPSVIDSSIQATTLYVRYVPTSAQGIVTALIQHTSGNAIPKYVLVRGHSIDTEPLTQSSLTIGETSGTAVIVRMEGGGGAGRLLVVRKGNPVSYVPQDGILPAGINSNFSLALDHGEGNKVVYYGSGTSVSITGLSVATTYYFACYEFNGTSDNAQNYLSVYPSTAECRTLAEAFINTEPATLNFGTIVVRGVSDAKSVTVSAQYLQPSEGTLLLQAPEGFALGLSQDATFVSSLTLPYTNEALPPTSVYVRFIPQSVKSYSDEVIITGGGTTARIAVSGTAADSSLLTMKAYYVSPTGNDSNSGTIDAPFATLTKAMSVATAGDVIYMRGGTYSYTTTFSTNKSGSAAKYINVWAYPGEKPVLDFSGVGSGKRGIEIRNDYWYFKGLEIKNAKDNGMYITGGYNKIEQCVFHGNGDSGLQISGGGHHNTIVNCDSYDNYDPGTDGGNADGFSPKLDVGDMNVFRGCRAWHNSDDGWDLFGNKYTVIIDSCWTWSNGFNKGNGNGFKTGGDYAITTVVLTNCLSFNNRKKGFDQNHNMGSVTVYNCTGYNNDWGNFYFYEEPTGGTHIFKNNISYRSRFRNDSLHAKAQQAANSWLLPSFRVTDADFVSLDTLEALRPRKADGSLPDINLLKLASTSRMIDAGVDVGIPYAGTAPDLGYWESAPTTVVQEFHETPAKFLLLENYPNPFNPTTTFRYVVEREGIVSLNIYNTLGEKVTTIVHSYHRPGMYEIRWNASAFPTGVYFAVLDNSGKLVSHKVVLVK